MYKKFLEMGMETIRIGDRKPDTNIGKRLISLDIKKISTRPVGKKGI